MDQKPAAVPGKNKSGIKNETAQEIEKDKPTLLMAVSCAQGQQSGVKKTEPDVKQEASSPQAGNTTQRNVDLKIREILKQAWQQMSSQEQIKQTEQLKQLFEKYVVVANTLIREETLCQNLKSLNLDHPGKFKTSESTTVSYKNYVTQYSGRKKILFLGINPNQRGMELGGVPFCEDECFINWLGISESVEQSTQSSPNANSDESDKAEGDSTGKRFWGLVKEICGKPKVFFKDCFVRNYCPFPILDDKGKYVSLSDIKVPNRKFETSCDQALRECVQALGVGIVVAAGVYVTERAKKALDGSVVVVVQIPHPSRHNSKWEDDEDWKQQAKDELGIGILKIMNPSYKPPSTIASGDSGSLVEIYAKFCK